MTRPQQDLETLQDLETKFNLIWPAATTVAAFLFVLTFALSAQLAQAQTYTFSSVYNINFPVAGVSMDASGSLYGTTEYGADNGNCGEWFPSCGTVFEVLHTDSGWAGHRIYEFQGGNGGGNPWSRVVVGPSGLLYGTTVNGGGQGCGGDWWAPGCGIVYSITPAPSGAGLENVLYRFQGGSDGAGPYAEVVFDQAGNLYGTTLSGGTYGDGTVYKLTPSTNGWAESIIYRFTGGLDGSIPFAGLSFDQAGNLYGTTSAAGAEGYGTVFELTPSEDGWTEKTLYSFTGGNDGGFPIGGVIFDAFGNLYGDTSNFGPPGDAGTAFELIPSNGDWSFNLIAGFPYRRNGNDCWGSGPNARLGIDTAGNLYGTTCHDGAYGGGSVFQLSPSGTGWNYTDLHDFRPGENPYSNVIFDARGIMYGTDNGGVFEMTP